MASSLAAKSIHIRTKPPPRSLSESKLILSALQKFGEVVTFRSLKYDTSNTSPTKFSTIVAIFDTPSSAAQAIAASPLHIHIPCSSHHHQTIDSRRISNTNTNTNTNTTDPANNNTNNNNIRCTISSDTNPTLENTNRSLGDAIQKGGGGHLTCTIQPSYHNHESALKRNPFYKMFELEKETAQYRDLVEGTRIPLAELADTPTARKEWVPARVRRKVELGTERLGATSLTRLFKEGFVIEREREREAEKVREKQQEGEEKKLG